MAKFHGHLAKPSLASPTHAAALIVPFSVHSTTFYHYLYDVIVIVHLILTLAVLSNNNNILITGYNYYVHIMIEVNFLEYSLF